MPWNRTTQQIHKRPDDHSQNDLTDAEWTIIEPMLPKQGRMGRPREVDLRSVFDAVRYILRRDAVGVRHPLDIHRFPPTGTIFTHGGGAGSWSVSCIVSGTSRGGVRGAPRSRPPPPSTAGR